MKKYEVMKKPIKKVAKKTMKRGTAKDLRNNGRWLCAAVTIGRGTDVHTHANGKKRFAFRFLPKSSDAVSGKPRGLDKIRDTMDLHICNARN